MSAGMRHGECRIRQAGAAPSQPAGSGTPQRALRIPQSARGGVLLLVLWLTAALSFVALALALLVRTELAATSYRLEAEQARFLARGALEQALYVINTPGLRDVEQKLLYEPGQPYLDFSYDIGTARVTVTSESGKLNLNTVTEERLRLLLQASGASEPEAEESAQAIADWRSAGSDVGSRFDQSYAGLSKPYRAAHRPFERLEELLLVKGITPEMFYGWMERDAQGDLQRRGGVNRLLTVYGSFGQVNLNYAAYEVLRTIPGLDDQLVRRLIEGRREKPYRSMADLPVALPLEALPHLALSEAASSVYVLTATGQPQGSATRASVRAVFTRDTTGEAKLLAWEEQAIAEDSM